MADAEFKRCSQCGQSLPREMFSPCKSAKSGLYSWCKPCAVKKVREYIRKKPDWRERKRAYDRARVDANREILSAKWSSYYERNKERALASAKQWAANNPEKRKAVRQNYKHRHRAVERQGMSGRELLEWKRAQPKVCHWCGVRCSRGFVVDHIRPLAKGGTHEATNLAISCRPCNAKKAAKDPIDFARELGKLL